MALVKTALPATLPATQRKTLANASVPALMGNGIFRESVTAESLIAPRDLVSTPTLALTGLGVGASPLSIVQGLITLAVRHAHGNAIDGIENLPAAARIGLQATLACLKKGAGCRPNQLEAAAKAGIEAMLDLPSPASKKKLTAPANEPAAPEASDTTTASEPPAPPNSEPTTATEPTAASEAVGSPEEWLDRSRELAEKTAQICASEEEPIDRLSVEIEKARKTLTLWKEGAAELPTDTLTEIVAGRGDAEQVLRVLAKTLGYRIVLAHKKVA